MSRVAALGFFDGVHLGHGALLKKVIEVSENTDLTPAVISFDIHPDNLVTGKETYLINNAKGKHYIINNYYGIDDVIFLHFNESLMKKSWDDFLHLLTEQFDISHIVAGYDFRFGYKGLGNADILKEYCTANNIGCDIINQVNIDGITVSSTYIREQLLRGNMEEASKFLGHPYIFVDTVRSGFHLGSAMGFPTINMEYSSHMLIPAFGVYAGKTIINGEKYLSVTNIGRRPTVSDTDKITVETNILDYSGNLYGKEIYLELYKFLRSEQKFSSNQELFDRIKIDGDSVRKFFK